MVMKRLKFSIFRRKVVQASAEAALAASTAPPDSGFAFVQNSQGASAALGELSAALMAVLNEIDLHATTEDSPMKARLSRLESAAGKYANSNSASCSGLREWSGSQSMAQIANVAFSCSSAMYKTPPKSSTVHDGTTTTSTPAHRLPHVPGVTFNEQEYLSPTQGGTAKAMGMWTAKSDMGHDELPAVVIAIRGTAKFVDCMVNLNGRPAPAAAFLGAPLVYLMGDDATAAAVSAHGGFLNCAKVLWPSVQRRLSMTKKTSPEMHVIFCGHSAGGAVASILFAKSLLEAASGVYPTLTFSCITFGAPPVFTVDLTHTLQSASLANNRGHILAFVNEFDVVPRADQAYIRSLIDLYRAIYNLEPLMTAAVSRKEDWDAASSSSDGDKPSYLLPDLHFDEESCNIDDGNEKEEKQETWNLPLPEYHLLGDIILLRKDRKVNAESGKIDRLLRTYVVPPREYQRLLFCGTETHSRTYYADRMGLLLEGMFNERQSW